jgi:chromosome segregation ATPase
MKIIAFVVAPLLAIALVVTIISWRGSIQEKEKLGQQLAQAKTQIQALEAQNKDLGKKADTLTANLKASEAKVNQGEEAIYAKERELNSLKTANQSMSAEQARLKLEAQKVVQALKDTQAAIAEADVYRERLAKKEAEVVVLTQERDRILAELDQAKKTINLLDLKNSEVTASLSFLGRPVFEPEMLSPLETELY